MRRISIIIPCWGEYAKYLPEALKSLSEQTYRDYELIVIDDCQSLPEARNKGIREATGEYILPLDVDDRLDPRYIERVLQENADVITTNYQEFGDSNAQGKTSDEFTLETILRGDKPIACSVFKKSKWEEIGGYDENFSQGFEDWDFWIRMAKSGASFKKISEKLYFYRKHKGQMSEGIHYNQELFNKLNKKHEDLCSNPAILSE